MVSILPSARSSWDIIGDQLGANLSQNLPRAIEQASHRKMLQESLGNIKNLATSGASPLDISLAAMQAGAGIPGSERYMGQIIPMLQQLAVANASQSAPLAGEQPGMPREHAPMEPMTQRQPAPSFLNQQPTIAQQNFPTAVGPQGGPGQVPQAATTGQKLPLYTPSELIPQAKQLAQERTAAGIPTTAREALDELKENEKSKVDYNKAIDEELKQRVEGQQTYGERAVKYLENVLPKASPELQARFQKLGEQASMQGKSEADINAFLAEKAKNLGNQITNIKKSLSAPRLQNFIGRKINGTYREFEDAAKDVRNHLQPLLDEGLYDTARLELSDLGYGPEERDMIINPLDERTKTVINGIPEVPKPKVEKVPGQPGIGVATARQIDPANIKDGLKNVFNSNPNSSLLLVRKAFEDKGYDWRSFKNGLNEMIQNGEIQLTSDQKNQLGQLDQPPLHFLEHILHGLNIIGR